MPPVRVSLWDTLTHVCLFRRSLFTHIGLLLQVSFHTWLSHMCEWHVWVAYVWLTCLCVTHLCDTLPEWVDTLTHVCLFRRSLFTHIGLLLQVSFHTWLSHMCEWHVWVTCVSHLGDTLPEWVCVCACARLFRSLFYECESQVLVLFCDMQKNSFCDMQKNSFCDMQKNSFCDMQKNSFRDMQKNKDAAFESLFLRHTHTCMSLL